MSYKYGNNGKLKQSRDEKIKCRNNEAVNYTKMIQNLTDEHNRIKQRLFKVQDHKYVLGLRDEIRETKEVIEELSKHNRRLKDDQYVNEKKMEQVMSKGMNDAMSDIQDKLKKLTVLHSIKYRKGKQLEFEEQNQARLEEGASMMSLRVKQLEDEVKSKGLSLSYQVTEDENDQGSKEYVLVNKKSIEQHSLNAIHRKFYTKIYEQRERLAQLIRNYNNAVETHQQQTFDDDKKVSFKEGVINVNDHPLMQQIDQSLSDLQKSLPKISSKLPWDKPRFIEGSQNQPYIGRLNSRSRLSSYANGSKSEDTRGSNKRLKSINKGEYDGNYFTYNPSVDTDKLSQIKKEGRNSNLFTTPIKNSNLSSLKNSSITTGATNSKSLTQSYN